MSLKKLSLSDMKTTYRVPVGQFEFVEVVSQKNMTEAEVAQNFYTLRDAFKVQEGIDDKVMDTFVQNQLMETGNDVNIYEAMTPAQQKEVQRVKRIMKRLKTKE